MERHDPFKVIIFYSYITIPEPAKTAVWLRALAETHNLLGRAIVAEEVDRVITTRLDAFQDGLEQYLSRQFAAFEPRRRRNNYQQIRNPRKPKQ